MKEPSPGGVKARPRAVRAVGAAGIGVAALVGGVWLFRGPLIETLVERIAAERGLALAVDVAQADFSGVTLRNLDVTADGDPQARAEAVAIGLRWTWRGPAVARVAASAPELFVRIDERGFVSPLLDALTRGDGEPPEPGPLPAIDVAIERGVIRVDTPVGRADGRFSAQGLLTQTFTAELTMPTTTLTNGARRLEGLSANATARTQDGALIIAATGALASADLGWRADDVQLSASGTIPEIASGARMALRAQAALLSNESFDARALTLDAKLDPIQTGWRIEAHLTAPTISGPQFGATALDVTVGGHGAIAALAGEWRARTGTLKLADVTAQSPSAEGAFTINRPADAPMVASVSGVVALSQAAIEPAARARLVASLPQLDGVPGGALAASLRDAVDRGLAEFSTNVKAELDWRDGAGRLTVFAPVRVDLGGGGVATFQTDDRSGAVTALLPSGAITARGDLILSGGGFPDARIALTGFESGPDGLNAEGVIDIRSWRSGGDALVLPSAPFAISSDARGGAAKILARPVVSSATGAVTTADLVAPLDLEAQWAAGSYAVTLGGGCAPVRAAWLGAAGHRFENVALSLCPAAGGVIAGARPDRKRYGGFTIDAPAFTGRLDGGGPARVTAARIDAANVGAGADGRFEFTVSDLSYRLGLDASRTIGFDATALTGRTGEAGGPLFRGALSGGRFVDADLGVDVTEIASGWRAVARSGETALELTDAVARITDVRPEAIPPDVWLARFQPVLVHDFEMSLAGAKLAGAGDLLLAEGRRSLARLNVAHDLETGVGRGEAANEALVFSSELDLYEITELARGVVDQVTGPVAIAAHAEWTRDTFTTGALVSPSNIAFNTAALGPVRGLSGRIAFDDLIAVTTPPGQIVTIESINPGVPVENGEIALRLLGPDRVEIQSASWPFADGRLSVQPLVLLIGQPDFGLTLTLDEVDVAQFLERLAITDLTATGKVEGVFPLVFTKTGGRVVDGRLRAAEGGGVIRYTSAAADGIEGASSWAFDALSAFRYDTLQLELDGDLDGELVTGIRFTGKNLAPLEGLTPERAIPLPFGQVDTTGLDFVFNVSVRAPFRNLVDSYASTQDARPIVDEAIRTGTIDQSEPPQ